MAASQSISYAPAATMQRDSSCLAYQPTNQVAVQTRSTISSAQLGVGYRSVSGPNPWLLSALSSAPNVNLHDISTPVAVTPTLTNIQTVANSRNYSHLQDFRNTSASINFVDHNSPASELGLAMSATVPAPMLSPVMQNVPDAEVLQAGFHQLRCYGSLPVKRESTDDIRVSNDSSSSASVNAVSRVFRVSEPSFKASQDPQVEGSKTLHTYSERFLGAEVPRANSIQDTSRLPIESEEPQGVKIVSTSTPLSVLSRTGINPDGDMMEADYLKRHQEREVLSVQDVSPGDAAAAVHALNASTSSRCSNTSMEVDPWRLALQDQTVSTSLHGLANSFTHAEGTSTIIQRLGIAPFDSEAKFHPLAKRFDVEDPSLHVFGPDACILVKQSGHSAPCRISFELSISGDVFAGLELWKNRKNSTKNLTKSICYTLSCYLTSMSLEELSSLRSEWPTTGKLSMNISHMGKQIGFPLSPPYEVAPNGMVDLSDLLSEGGNLVEIVQSSNTDTSGYQFVLRTHHPTVSQIQWASERCEKEENWRKWLHGMAQPLDIPLVGTCNA